MRRIELLTVAALAVALPAAAGPLDEAKRILDSAAPMHCELLKMQFQARAVPRDSPAYAALAQRFDQRSAAVEQALAGDMQRFEAARAMLNTAEQDELTAHGKALMQACAQQAERETGVRMPLETAAPRPRLKVAPYVPAGKSVNVQAAPSAPLQAQDPQ